MGVDASLQESAESSISRALRRHISRIWREEFMSLYYSSFFLISIDHFPRVLFTDVERLSNSDKPFLLLSG
jgi:hypothetical protein